jgi:hypothetical protein
MNLLLLGTKVDEVDYDNVHEQKKEIKLLKDKTGKVRTFMLRRAAAKEAHTINGTVMPYKNGYVIKLNEENEDVEIYQKPFWQLREASREPSVGRPNESSTGESGQLRKEYAELTSANEYAKGEGIQLQAGNQAEKSTKITLAKIRAKQKEKVKESIDKGIEPGVSMSATGENPNRPSLKTKQNKKPFEEAIGAGGEDATSMSDYNENLLKQKGINIKTFKAKRPIG